MSFFLCEYFPILILFSFSSILSFSILAASFLLNTQKPDAEKTSVYECGFDPYDDSRNKFDVRFFLVAVLFLLFDLESMFLFPWSISLGHIGALGYWTMVDFMVELLIGLLYVWSVGGFDWI